MDNLQVIHKTLRITIQKRGHMSQTVDVQEKKAQEQKKVVHRAVDNFLLSEIFVKIISRFWDWGAVDAALQESYRKLHYYSKLLDGSSSDIKSHFRHRKLYYL